MEQTQTSQSTCSKCGMSRREWKGNGGAGVKKGGATFCCDGCAQDKGCACR